MISEQLRHLIVRSHESYHDLFIKTGVPIGSISRFMTGKAGLSMDNIDLLCKHYKVRLVTKDKGEIGRTTEHIKGQGRPKKGKGG
jgi:transcriptional regulator with XRE-family HTH domain